MARNYVQAGEVLTLIAPGNVNSGDVVIVGAILGIAAYNAAQGEPVETSVEGVYELAKATPLAIDAGDVVYWAVSAKNVTKTASDAALGICTEAAGSSATKVRVLIDTSARLLAARVGALEAAP